jgi:hypothetical protein
MNGCYQSKDARIKIRLESNVFIVDDVDVEINSLR